jgi:uncharacterized damage-inducible protein DinB
MRVQNTSYRSYSIPDGGGWKDAAHRRIETANHGKEPFMTSLPYAQMIDIKRWADRGLYDAVSRNFDRLRPEDVSIMLRVLDHIHVVDQIFQHHLQGVPHRFEAARSREVPTFETLANGAREVDNWYASYVGGLAEADFEQPVDFVFTSGKPARMRRGEIILHVCLHGTYHRGNAGAVLQLQGLTPSPDAITDFLEAA